MIHQDARVYAGLFDGAERAELALAGRRAATCTSRAARVTVNGQRSEAGDALKTDAPTIVLEERRRAWPKCLRRSIFAWQGRANQDRVGQSG